MSPKVSVIVPVYNVSEYLGQCLDTILLQTLQDIEVICVDDGSTDDSLSILQTYAMFDERMKVIHQENAGPGAARNRGLKEAKGEFIIFLDSDDFFELDMLEKMVAKAEMDNSDIVVAGHYLYDNNIKQKINEVKIEEKYLQKSPAKPEDFGKDLFFVCNMGPVNKLIHSDIIKKNKLEFDEKAKYAEDLYMTCFALACASQISVLKDSFVYYRVNQTTSLTAKKQEHFEDCLHIFNRLYERLLELNLKDKFEKTFLLYMKQTMVYVLPHCLADQKRERLRSIRKILKPELFERLFFCSEKEKVSIIIPVYNAAEFLPECLDSCLNQTLKEIEVICVDDGSTDNSLDILNEYAKRDSRIIVLQQKNQRQAIARNKAMEIASGRFVQFLDADDYMEPDTCECLYLYSEIFKLEMCQCTAIEFYNHNKKEFENPYHCLMWLPDNFQPVFNRYTAPNFLPHMAVTAWLTFYRHSFLVCQKIEWINKKIAYEDTPFFVESILKARRVGAIKAAFYHRRVHSMATTQQMATNFNEYMDILKYSLQIVKKLASQDILNLYCFVFLQKAWGNFAKLEVNDKLNMAQPLYDFCYFVQDEYHVVLPSNINDWCLRYVNDYKKSKKNRLKFKFSAIKSKLFRDEFRITLIRFSKRPCLNIFVLGIPILSSKIVVVPQTEADKKNKQIYQNVFIKFCGLPILKIQEAIRV